MLESRTLPPRLPEQDPGDYRWAAAGWTDDAHAFPPAVEGQLQKLAPCGARWTVRYGYEGGAKCATCIAALRDQLRAVSVALAAAGIRSDQPLGADYRMAAGPLEGMSIHIRDGVSRLEGPSTWDGGVYVRHSGQFYWTPDGGDDQRGDHFVRPDEAG